VPRNLDSVRETLFKQGSECGDLGRHGMEMIPNKYRTCKGQMSSRSRYGKPRGAERLRIFARLSYDGRRPVTHDHQCSGLAPTINGKS
jgi:hypothetical protein